MSSQEMTVLPRVSRTIEDVRASVFAHVEKVQDEFAAKGWLPARLNLNKGVVRGLLEIYCWGYWQIYALLQRLMQQAVPATATGDWLDSHAASVNLSRRPATKARGNVRFLRSSSLAGNVAIPARRIVRTLPDGIGQVYRYSSLADAVLPADAACVDVPVEAEDYGASANASAGQICELVTPVEGIAGVTNPADWLTEEGANEETDAQLRERYALQWQANNGCTKYAYMAWALSVPGVTSVSILDRHPRGQGTVDVVVRGADVLPTEALLEKVRAAIAPNVPINDDWLVKGPAAIPCAISGELEYTGGDPAAIVAQAEARIRALFAETSPLADVSALQIGQDMTPDLLTHTVMAVPGVKRVTWASPAQAVISVPADGVARLESLALSTTMAEEI
ncbi:baseplate J/gp47 family protein [Desulfovibrio sp. ZJ200]|uniref:baseplate J/gp47 family protein n=1 Tax=Desulfovibrio sp. ZJ200 TaxID=2709792 RepID=UPI00198044FD|nr:baseplate J/gp47 family protein [Desulfovibrio sp. ZJ200]